MLFTEYNEKAVMNYLKKEAYEDGFNAGIEQERSRADAAERENEILRNRLAELEKKLIRLAELENRS